MRKIDFSCRKLTIKDIITCNYSLSSSEYDVLNEIMKHKKGTSIKDLIKRLEKQRTTIQKIISKLIQKDLIKRRQLNLDRGYMYIYLAKNKEEIVKEIEKNVNSYFESLKKSLERWKD